MNYKTMALTAATLLELTGTPAFAADLVGYNSLVVPASSDVRLSLPFTQKVEATFTVNSKSASGVTITGALTAAQYANLYYVRFTSGNASGLWSTITTNGVSDLTLADLNVLALVNAGDTFRVYKHHTLNSVFPKGMLGKSFVNGTQILIYDNNIAAMTINKSASRVAAYTTSGGGQWVGAGVNGNTILKPETQFILRNNAAQTLQMITLGDVPDFSASALIAPNGDLLIGSGYPVPVVLKNAGLNGNLRQVLFYDNAASGINKSAVKVATFTTSGGGNWVGAGVTGNELITPSATITLRLPVSEAGTKVTLKKPY